MSKPNWKNHAILDRRQPTHHAGYELRDRVASMNSGHQFLVGQFLGLDDPSRGVMEDAGVIPVVESPLQFFEVAVHMLETHLVKRSDYGSLEQASDSLDPVGVNVPDHPLFGGVADGLMPSISVPDPDIGLQLVGVDGLGLVCDCAPDEVMQGVPIGVGDALNSDLACLPLDGSGHPGLAFLAPRSDVAFLSTDQGFVHFHHSKERGTSAWVISHGLADTVGKIPGRSAANRVCARRSSYRRCSQTRSGSRG